MGLPQIIIYSIISLINLGIFIGCLIHYYPYIFKYFCYLTLINLTLSTIYLVARVYIELSERNGNTIKEEIKHFWHHHYYKYNFITSFSIMIVYWVLCSLGDDIMFPGDTWEYLAISIYLHGILCIVIFADLFIGDHKHTDNHKFDFFLIGGFLLVYYVLLYFCKYWIEFMVYPFLIIMNFQQILVLFVMITLINFNVHQLYHFLLDKKHKKIENNLSKIISDPERTNIINLVKD